MFGQLDLHNHEYLGAMTMAEREFSYPVVSVTSSLFNRDCLDQWNRCMSHSYFVNGFLFNSSIFLV